MKSAAVFLEVSFLTGAVGPRPRQPRAIQLSGSMPNEAPAESWPDRGPQAYRLWTHRRTSTVSLTPSIIV